METILITGSSRGIGKAIAQEASARGYHVIVHGKSDSVDLEQTHKLIIGSTKTFFDITNKADVYENLSKLGQIDILVNNAGMGKTGVTDINNIDDGDAESEYRVNVLGTLHCVQAVLPGMLSRGSGSVVNIGSIKGHYELTTLSSLTYGLSKAAVIALTQGLAKAYPAVRFNSVSPGYVSTDMAKEWPPETFDRIKSGTLTGRISEPSEIAKVVMFLASQDASYITGIDILADGGYKLKGK